MTVEIGVREVPEGNEAAARGRRKGQESWAGGVAAELGRENKAEGNEEVMVRGLGGLYDVQPEPLTSP